MGAILKAGDVNPDELARLVEQVRAPDELRIWAEGVGGWALDYWKGLDAPVLWYSAGSLPTALPGREVLERARSGRLFAPSGELKWRILPTPSPPRLRMVFLGSHDWLVGELVVRDELDRLGLSHRNDQAILWGQKTPHSGDDWVELRIPHRFRYPVPEIDAKPEAGVGVKVLTEVWSDGRGEPHFVRLRELVPYPIGEEQ